MGLLEQDVVTSDYLAQLIYFADTETEGADVLPNVTQLVGGRARMRGQASWPASQGPGRLSLLYVFCCFLLRRLQSDGGVWIPCPCSKVLDSLTHSEVRTEMCTGREKEVSQYSMHWT